MFKTHITGKSARLTFPNRRTNDNNETPGTVEVRVIGLDKKGTPTGTSTWRLAGQPCGRPWALSGPQVHCRRLAKDVPRSAMHSHSLYISLYPQVHVDGTPKVRLAKTTPEASRRPGDYERMPPPRSYGICR